MEVLRSADCIIQYVTVLEEMFVGLHSRVCLQFRKEGNILTTCSSS